MRWIAPKVGATVFGGLHLLVVGVPVISTWGNGEGQAFAVAIFDRPLVALISLFEVGEDLLYNGPNWAYVGVFAIGGTLMYSGAGALVGWAVQRLIRAVRSGARAA
jgi:hypothetical protein